MDGKLVKTITTRLNGSENFNKIVELQQQNDRLANDVMTVDHDVLMKHISFKSMVLQIASNMEELYILGGFPYPSSCIYGVIARNFKNKGLSQNGKELLCKIFGDPENARFTDRHNQHLSKSLYEIPEEQQSPDIQEVIKSEQNEVLDQAKKSIEFLESLKGNRSQTTALQYATIKVQELAPKMIDRCDDVGINLPGRDLTNKPIKIRVPDPKKTSVTDALQLLIDKLTKVKEKFERYHPEPEHEDDHTKGIMVFVRLLDSVTDDKWARNWWTWFGILREKEGQSNHSASSKSQIMGKLFGRRGITREQIRAKPEVAYKFAMDIIEHSLWFWDICYLSTKCREPFIADFHSERHSKLSNNA